MTTRFKMPVRKSRGLWVVLTRCDAMQGERKLFCAILSVNQDTPGSALLTPMC